MRRGLDLRTGAGRSPSRRTAARRRRPAADRVRRRDRRPRRRQGGRGQGAVHHVAPGRATRPTTRESRSIMIHRDEPEPHSEAMMTGAYGNSSGLPRERVRALLTSSRTESSCHATGPADESKPPTVTSGESPTCRVAETVFEAIRRQGNPRTACSQRRSSASPSSAGSSPPQRTSTTCGRRARRARDDDSYCGNVPTEPGHRLRGRRQDRDGRGAPHYPRGHRRAAPAGPTSRS